MSRITVIEPTLNPVTHTPIFEKAKRKVAVYARVSTDEEEQESSYEAQKEYYERYVKSRDDWSLVSIYADEGISGTNIKKRKQFVQMIDSALAGEIDLIVTKSISRFARNTLDTISTVRALKEKHVEVYFEKENIWTLDSKSELLLTIMASLAQEESHSISENVKWGIRASFQKGKYGMPYKHFLGYKQGENGKIEIDEEEAKLVRYIYKLFLIEGLTAHCIAQRLMKEGHLTATKNPRWSKNGVLSILTNEKYCGRALLQKGYVENYLDHKVVKNNGVLPKYLVEGYHPNIIEVCDWERVQAEIKRRDEIGSSYSCSDIFSAKIICEDCGGFYGRKVWHSTDSYKRIIYQCNHKFDKDNAHKCRTPHLTEQEIMDKFVEAYNSIMVNKEKIINDLIELSELLGDTDNECSSLEETKTEMELVEGMVKVLLDKRGKTNELTEEEFMKQYQTLDQRFKKLEEKYKKLRNDITIKKGKKATFAAIAASLKEEPKNIVKWSKETWMLTTESAVVHKDKSITFKFYSSQQVRI